MTELGYDWRAVAAQTGDELRRSIFSILRDASLAVQSSDRDDPALLEIVPRLAEIVPLREELSSFKAPLSALARATGLWNYIDKECADEGDAIVAEAVTSPELDEITFHREQIAALNVLLAGRNLVLSAPTSFGKSLLIDALLATNKYKRIAIVLPTIALLDEFRRRLKRRFRDRFSLVVHHSDVPLEGPTIFLGTQERIIARNDLGSLDLTIVDEFYKLDPSRKDERNVPLNVAVYKLLRRSTQFFFLGPNIDEVAVAPGRWQFEFLRTRFSTVAVDTFDLRTIQDKRDRLFEEVGEDQNWPALVFVSSPDKANELAIAAAERMAVSDESQAFAHWLRDNVGEKWPLIPAVENGFAVHHGRIPRSIASHMIRMFNELAAPVLFCTSTLIEGVNTAAKTVLIFDRTINKARYDFFTFSNIKGRAGRLGQHHVGRVFLFNEPPVPEVMTVSPTLFGEEEAAPDDYVVHLDEDGLSQATDARLARLREDMGLNTAELRLASAVGLDTTLILKQKVQSFLRRGRQLPWAGYPNYENIKETVSVICEAKNPRAFGAFSASQLTFLINTLRGTPDLRSFLLTYDASFRGDFKFYENVFRFLRSCEYGLVQLFLVVELLIRKEGFHCDYSLFVRELGKWFRPECLKNLDEEGIPIQISERYYTDGDNESSIREKLAEACQSRESDLTPFERRWLSDALDLELSVRRLPN